MAWLRMVFAAALCLSLPALALADGADADCAAVLAAPPFVDMLTRNEGRDYHEFSSSSSAHLLLGLGCSVDELTVFFEDAGWEFLRLTEHKSSTGPFGVPSAEYYSDGSAHYCLKRPTLFGIFAFRCRPYARIDFYAGRVSNIASYRSK